MGKLLLFLSIVILLFLSVGAIYFPHNEIFLLASNSSVYQYIRGVLIFVLIIQLVTQPPRHAWIRCITGAISLSVCIWTINAMYIGQMLPFDGLAFMGASIAIGIAALECRIITPNTSVIEN